MLVLNTMFEEDSGLVERDSPQGSRPFPRNGLPLVESWPGPNYWAFGSPRRGAGAPVPIDFPGAGAPPCGSRAPPPPRHDSPSRRRRRRSAPPPPRPSRAALPVQVAPPRPTAASSASPSCRSSASRSRSGTAPPSPSRSRRPSAFPSRPRRPGNERGGRQVVGASDKTARHLAPAAADRISRG
jgi:hypothetical protein